MLPAVVRRVEPQGFTKVSALGVEEQRAPGHRLWGRVILRRAPDALKVPLGALVRANGRWAVYRIVAGRARLTPVRRDPEGRGLVVRRPGVKFVGWQLDHPIYAP